MILFPDRVIDCIVGIPSKDWGERSCSRFFDRFNLIKLGKQANVLGGKKTSLFEDSSSSVSEASSQNDSL